MSFSLLGKLLRPGPKTPVADAVDIDVDASGFNGNLSSEDDTVQKVAQKVDDLRAAGSSGYAARLSVWPPNVAKHSDVQRTFKAILNELNEQVLRLDGGSTGTRFVNRFQIKTRNADRAEVLLHDEAWSFTTEGAQELEWDVNAAEFNQLGTAVSTDYIEVWGEFRAVYGGGVNEPRGRTQPFVIGFGEEADWPATRGDVAAEGELRAKGDDLQSITVSTLDTLNAALTAQEIADTALEIVFSADVLKDGTTYKNGDVVYVAPRSTAIESRFNIGTAGGVDAAARQAALDAMRAALANKASIDSIGKVSIGRIDVNPGRIRDAADLDGTYQCIVILTDAEQQQLQAAGVNYLEVWFGKEAVQIASPWAPALATRVDVVVDTTEETQIGAGVNVYPVRAVYRINQGGNQAYYAEGSGALRVGGYSVSDQGDTWNNVVANSAGGLNAEFVAYRLNDAAMLITITGDFATATRSYKSGQRWYLAPHQSSELFMVLVSEVGETQVQEAIAAALPPFADIRLLPEALPGSQVPDNFYVELAGKLTSREIDGITLLIQGNTIQPHASTPVSGFDTETQALVRFDVSSVADAIANGIEAADRELNVDVTFSFTEGDDVTRRIPLPVNNPNAPRLVQGKLDSIVFNAAITLDWLAPDMRTITLTADITFAFSNILVGRPLVLEVIQGGAGNHGITWPASVEWAGGSAEGPSAGANDVDIFTLLPLSSTRVLATALLDVS